MYPAIFFDRDGVIIENVTDYVRSWAEVQFLPGSISALARLASSPYKIVIVTNQAVVGRKIISLEEAWTINSRVVAEIERGGGRIDRTYLCPHASTDNCPCRKPRPGMILQAAEELALDLQRSILIGDALTDIEAGRRAGIPHTFLVQTGRGLAQSQLSDSAAYAPQRTFERMETAVAAILSGQY